MDYQETLHYNTMMKLANSRKKEEEKSVYELMEEKEEQIKSLKETIQYQKTIIFMSVVLISFSLLAIAVC